METTSKHQCKTGEKFLAEVEVDYVQKNGDLVVRSDYLFAIPEDPFCCADIVVKSKDVHRLRPVREEEYRMTIKDLMSLAYKIESYPAFFENDDECEYAVKKWLANRKEARNE